LAVEGNFRGEIEFWGVSNDNENLNYRIGNSDYDAASNSWLQMLVDMNINFKINDNVTLITRFEALDKKWGTNQNTKAVDVGDTDTAVVGTDHNHNALFTDEGGNFTWEEAFVVIKTKIGGFVIGRMPDGPWGTDFGDTTDPADRFNWVVPIDKWKFAFTYEKWYEVDSDVSPTKAALGLDSGMYDQSDSDNDKYYLSAQYTDDNMKFGLLGTYYRVETLRDLGGSNEFISDVIIGQYFAAGGTGNLTVAAQQGLFNAVLAGAEGPARASSAVPFAGQAYVLTPYFIGTYGNLDIKAEALYGWGSGDYDDTNKFLKTTFGALPIDYEIPDRDLEVYQYMLEGTYHIGPLAITGGYAVRSGDELGSDDDDKLTAIGLFDSSGDFTRGFILNDYDYTGLNDTLGGIGNLSASDPYSSPTLVSGYKMFYIGLGYAPMENLNLEFLYANSKAESPIDRKGYDVGAVLNPAFAGLTNKTSEEKWDDDHGSEYDFILSWKFADNVEYKFIAAYLAAGDFWKRGVADAKVDDLFTIFHLLTVRF
jgi:hypothetical protein